MAYQLIDAPENKKSGRPKYALVDAEEAKPSDLASYGAEKANESIARFLDLSGRVNPINVAARAAYKLVDAPQEIPGFLKPFIDPNYAQNVEAQFSLPQAKTEAIEQKYPKSSFIAGVAGETAPYAAASAIPGVGPALATVRGSGAAGGLEALARAQDQTPSEQVKEAAKGVAGGLTLGGVLRASGYKAEDVSRLANIKQIQKTAGPKLFPEEFVSSEKINLPLQSETPIAKDLGPIESTFSLSLLSPERAVNEITGKTRSLWHDRLIVPFKEAQTNISLKTKNVNEEIRNLGQKFGIKPGSKEDIILRRVGEGAPDLGGSSKKTAELLSNIRQQYDQSLDDINIARSLRNLDPIERRQDYFTHISELNSLDQVYGSIANAPNEAFKRKGISKTPFFGPSLQRTGQKTPTAGAISSLKREGGLQGLFARAGEKFATTEPPGALEGLALYRNKADSVIERMSAASQIEQHLESLPPRAKQYFTDWVNRSVLQKMTPLESQLRAPLTILQKGQQAAVQSLVSGSLRTAASQFSSIPSTVQRTGVKNVVKGLPKIFSEEVSKSRPVLLRTNIPDLNPDVFNDGLFKGMLKVANYPMMAIDRLQVRLAYAAGLAQGESKGLTGKALRNFADSVASQTQGEAASGLKAGIQETKIGQLAAPLQTFVINLYNTFRRDPKIIGKESGKLAMIKNLSLGVGGLYAMNKIYESMGVAPPYNIADFIPLVGGAIRFGRSTPLIEPIIQLGKAISGEGYKGEKARADLWKLPLKFVPGGGQIIKTTAGVQAIREGGIKNKKGKLQFPIRGVEEQLRALAFGPFQTKAGQEYFQKKERR